MPTKYIKVESLYGLTNVIVDVFFDFQKEKFDGTEISLGPYSEIEYDIYGHDISDENGVFTLELAELVPSPLIIPIPENTRYSGQILENYKTDSIEKTREALKNKGIFDIIDLTGLSLTEIVSAWSNFKSNIMSDTTKSDIDIRVSNVWSTLQLD